MRRGACALMPSAPRTAPSPPPAGARRRRPGTEGALTSLAAPPQTPLRSSLGRVRAAACPAGLHHTGREIGGHGRDQPRCGGGGDYSAKTAGMVGREKELSIHFVPGDCRLVEVRESARVLRGGETSHGNRVRRAGRVWWRGLEWFSRRILPESEALGD